MDDFSLFCNNILRLYPGALVSSLNLLFTDVTEGSNALTIWGDHTSSQVLLCRPSKDLLFVCFHLVVVRFKQQVDSPKKHHFEGVRRL